MSVAAEHLRTRANLSQLLQGMVQAPAISVNGICSDSRNAGTGDVFFAVQGQSSHGLDYVDQVLESGVAAVVWDQDSGDYDSSDASIPFIAVPGLKNHLGEIANRWFDFPSSKLRVAGITGTNGKTTVAWLLVQCLQLLGQRSAYVGTLGAGVDELKYAGAMTTPDCIELHGLLAEFAKTGATSTMLEVSSHGIAQQRVDGVTFDAAVFTNLSRDHLDYHGDMDSYFETKAKLFSGSELKHRIICVDSAHGRELLDRCDQNVIAVCLDSNAGIEDHPYLCVTDIVATEQGSTVSLTGSWGEATFSIGMPGRFNVSNAVLALALLLSWDVSLEDACRAMSDAPSPPGRLQRVGQSVLPAVYVDFAHTPSGLEAVLSALRPHIQGDLWCVFGCGGDRDHGKRQQMGEVVARLADKAIVTNDNPRSEVPGEIIREILQAMPQDTVAIEDRSAAIAYATKHAKDEDLVLIAGKGHEDYQIIGDQKLPFSDYTTALANLLAKQARDASRK